MVLQISNQSTLLRRFLRSKPYSPSLLSAAVLHRRHRSSHTGRGQIVEVDLQSLSSSDGETEVAGVKTLEEMIHRITVLKSTPDWLPFLPGSSFWVPPRTDSRGPSDIAQLMATMANFGHDPQIGNGSFSISTARGRPSSSFLLQGASFRHPYKVEVEEEDDHNDDIQLMLDEVEAEVEILEAHAQAEAEEDAEVVAEVDAEVVVEVDAKSKSQVPTNSRKYENEEG